MFQRVRPGALLLVLATAVPRLSAQAVDTAKSIPAPGAATALPIPAMPGPLQPVPPVVVDAGPFGRLALNAVVSGFGMVQSAHAPGDGKGQAALSNGQIIIQKADGWFQFYVQAGTYTLPALATPFINNGTTMNNFYGPVPVAFVSLRAGESTDFLVGALPTLIGAEYTFTFQDMDIARGLLWNQENAVNRGIQLNQALGKFSLYLSWNDGYYSDRYTWLSGSLGYTDGPHAVAFVAGGNYGQTAHVTPATPVQNNGSIYEVIYTFTQGAWIIQPYAQYSVVPTNASIGVTEGASTSGGAVLVNYSFKGGFSLPGRVEYIASSGRQSGNAVNLLFGPGSSGASLTLTPTFQRGAFFARAEASWVHATAFASGSAFGSAGTTPNQFRAVAEIGFILGNNIR